MRIGVGGLSCECCTFSPMISTAGDFQVHGGDELLARYGVFSDHPLANFIPLRWARALPGGPIDRVFYDAFKSDLLAEIQRVGPLDGIFLHMHGAAYVVGLDDAEGDFVSSIRGIVGPECVLSASYDLHGNVSPTVMRHVDILTAYRTAPHVDWYDTLERACSLLIKCLGQRRLPHISFIPVPILLAGEKTSTEWEPGASLYGSIPQTIKDFDLLDASVLTGYVWADEPRSTASVITLGFDRRRTQQAAIELAGRFWQARFNFDFGSPAAPTDECIRRALHAKNHPVVISDSGDNPTAGGVGDVPYLLERLVALEVPDAVLASIVDPAAVASCVLTGVGGEVELRVGGKLDPTNGTPLEVRGEVVTIDGAESGGVAGNTIVVVRIAGINTIITERRTPFHHIEDFRRLGIDPFEHHIVVVKIGYLVPDLRQMAGTSLIALSPGAVDQDVVNLPFGRIRRPMFPFDPTMQWDPANELGAPCRR